VEVLHPLLGEGQRLLVACADDPEAAVLRLQFDGDFVKQLLVFTEELGGAGNRVSERRRRHRQAARSTETAGRQFQGRSSASLVTL